MTEEQMKDMEQELLQTYYDQGGGCSFLQWIKAVSNDPKEFMHEEAKAYLNH